MKVFQLLLLLKVLELLQEIGDFKKGPFHLASNTGATIIPIGLIGAFEAKADWRHGRVLITRFGKPIHRRI